MVATDEAHFDFVVMGGGTAGNVVAGRLAEKPNVTFLVVEAGVGNSHEIEEITTPAMAMELRSSKYDWAYKTTMVKRDDYERIEKPNTRGKASGAALLSITSPGSRAASRPLIGGPSKVVRNGPGSPSFHTSARAPPTTMTASYTRPTSRRSVPVGPSPFPMPSSSMRWSPSAMLSRRPGSPAVSPLLRTSTMVR
jgi:hypothetical protein